MSRRRSRKVALPGPDFPDAQSSRWSSVDNLHLAGRTGNILFSPYAVASTLEVLLHAARGATAQQITCALHLQPACRSRRPITEDYFARLHAQCRSCVSVSSLRLKVGNLICHDGSLRIRRKFRRSDGARPVRLRPHNFVTDPDGSLARIAEDTRQAMPHFGAHEILPESSTLAVAQPGLVSHTSLLLLSFVGFAGGWRLRFSRACTTDAQFHLAPGRTKKGKTTLALARSLHEPTGLQKPLRPKITTIIAFSSALRLQRPLHVPHPERLVQQAKIRHPLRW
ncbi:hypothetical protein MRX96_044675 [Rhipicephalus microplus]